MTKKTDSIAARIRWAREKAQLSPIELRQALKEAGEPLSKTGLHRLETEDAKNPNLSLIRAIAGITRVSPSWILFGEGASTPSDEVGAVIRSRVIDTIELMVGALDMSARQESSIRNWLQSMRQNPPKSIKRP